MCVDRVSLQYACEDMSEKRKNSAIGVLSVLNLLLRKSNIGGYCDLVVVILIFVFCVPDAVADVNSEDGWTAIPSARFPTRTKSQSQSDLIQDGQARATDVGLSDKVLSLELKESKQEPAIPRITEFGDQGSNENQDDGLITDSQLLDSARPVDGSSILPITNLDMFVGQLQVLGKVDVTRVAIGNGGIIRAEVLKTGELLVIGQAEGSTSLRLWNKNGTQTGYNIRVGARDPETRIRMERMVRMRVRMVDFSKRALTSLGINWGTDTAGPTFAAAGDAIGNNLFRPGASEVFGALPNQVAPFSTYLGIASDITSKINFLSSNGDGVTLAEPVLSAVNGGEASFLAGGEVPYSTIGSNGLRTTEFKEYGVRLQVAPRIDANGNIRTFVEIEESSVDEAVSVNGAPGLKVRRAQTEVNVRSGETIVISGLLASESSDTVDAVPGLGRLPLLGRLFRSKGKDKELRELVIFLTPEVVEPLESTMTATNQEIYESTSRALESVRTSRPLME